MIGCGLGAAVAVLMYWDPEQAKDKINAVEK